MFKQKSSQEIIPSHMNQYFSMTNWSFKHSMQHKIDEIVIQYEQKFQIGMLFTLIQCDSLCVFQNY